MAEYLNDPMGIEKRSFEIIEKELPMYGTFDFDEKQQMIVKRLIHTTADFEYAKLVSFNSGAVEKGMAALAGGCRIYVDTNMIKAGINKVKCRQFGCEIVNYVSDEDIRIAAKERGVTRSTVAMEKACKDNGIKIFVIGNAPTALYALMKNIKYQKVKPDLIIGVPVGFVGAAESKAELLRMPVPSIVISGRKGGSTTAVAILNALFYLLDNNR